MFTPVSIYGTPGFVWILEQSDWEQRDLPEDKLPDLSKYNFVTANGITIDFNNVVDWIHYSTSTAFRSKQNVAVAMCKTVSVFGFKFTRIQKIKLNDEDSERFMDMYYDYPFRDYFNVTPSCGKWTSKVRIVNLRKGDPEPKIFQARYQGYDKWYDEPIIVWFEEKQTN